MLKNIEKHLWKTLFSLHSCISHKLFISHLLTDEYFHVGVIILINVELDVQSALKRSSQLTHSSSAALKFHSPL